MLLIMEKVIMNNNIGKKINNFFDDIEELDEDNMQKLELKPTPINEPTRKKTYMPTKKKNKFALQKKTKTDRAENVKTIANNNSNTIKKKLNNDKSKDKDKEKEKLSEELIKNKINEEDFTEPKEEKMLINKQNEEKHKFEAKSKTYKNNENNLKKKEEQKTEKDKEEEKENNENKQETEEIENKNEEEEEKVDEKEQSTNLNDENIPYIIEEQEALIANHMDIIKSEAKLLTEEGNLISRIKGITEENYTMEEYVYKIEDIIKTKLKYFQDLKQKIKEYKSLLG